VLSRIMHAAHIHEPLALQQQLETFVAPFLNTWVQASFQR
jgi:hypothetical protein